MVTQYFQHFVVLGPLCFNLMVFLLLRKGPGSVFCGESIPEMLPPDAEPGLAQM